MHELSEQQQDAVNDCCDMTRRIISVTGPAGTGKTTIFEMVFKKLRDEGINCVLAAPTGKAAKRIYEITGIDAVTIHRLLEYPYPGERDPKTGKALSSTVPKRDRRNPINYDMVLCDEYAMVKHEVHNNLLAALPRGGCIRMFGDLAQLPPIEENKLLAAKPSPFTDMLKRFKAHRLETIFRQEEGSGILRNAKMILSGRVPRREDDFKISITSQPIRALEEYVFAMADEGVHFDVITNQIISPGKRSWVGTYKLNSMLQNIYRPNAVTNGIRLPRHEWEKMQPVWIDIGDKIVWTQNTYDLRSFPDRFHDSDTFQGYIPPARTDIILNGETGVVTDIVHDGSEAGTFTIDVGDRHIIVPNEILELTTRDRLVAIDPRTRCSLAYALTTHKAQGSEYDHVVYMINKSLMYMLGRHNFYTGITRARKKVHVIADMLSIQTAVTRTEIRGAKR